MHDATSIRPRHRTLRVQADVLHTFGPLLIPLAVILVIWGGFQLERSIAHPLESDAASILFGSVILACGFLLVSYLLRSIRIFKSPQARADENLMEQPASQPVSRRTKTLPHAPPPRPFHRFYVDSARISR
ncbi:MAG TPA: hypothetical protein VN025_03475 [Candidatus Dormibacteraeota bacterium]|jgi:hypothetical protein|nr:hypothetical protein [Candidatus Dormibacteraeota bacterium]